MPQQTPDLPFAPWANQHLWEGAVQTIRHYEGVHPKIYLDPRAVPTLGAGIALGRLTEQKTGQQKVVLFPRATLNRILPQGAALDARVYEVLACIVTSVNQGGLPLKEGQKLISKLPFVLTTAQEEALFQAQLAARFTAIGHALTEKHIDPQALSHEAKLIIVDLYFRGGRNLIFGLTKTGADFAITKALQQRHWGLFLAEVLYGSNGDGLPGNDLRMFEQGTAFFMALTHKQQVEVGAYLKQWCLQYPHQVIAVKRRLAGVNKRRKTQGLRQVSAVFWEEATPAA